MDDPRALEPLNEQDSPLTTGRELAMRIERFEELKDSLTRGPVPIMDQHYNPRKVWLVRNETGEPPAWSEGPKEPARRGRPARRRGGEGGAARLPAPVRRGFAARSAALGPEPERPERARRLDELARALLDAPRLAGLVSTAPTRPSSSGTTKIPRHSVRCRPVPVV